MSLNPNDNNSIRKLSVGDTVQIKSGSIDVTNGRMITARDLYIENSGSWGKVENIIEDYKPKTSLGFNTNTITAIQIGNGKGTVMMTVQPQDIASNRIYSSNTQLALSALSPLTSAINSRNISAIGNILGSTNTILNLTGNQQTGNNLTSYWAKALQIDSSIASDYITINNLYNNIKNLFGIGKTTTQQNRVLGTLGAAKQIQNWTQTTQLIPKMHHNASSASTLDRLIGIASAVDSLINSVKILTGGAGAASMQTGIPVYPVNANTGRFEVVDDHDHSGVGNTSGSVGGTVIDNTLSNTANDTIRALTVDAAKGVGGYEKLGSSSSKIGAQIGSGNYPKPDTTTVHDYNEYVTGYRYPYANEVRNIGIMNQKGLRIATNIIEHKGVTVPELSRDLLINNFPTNETFHDNYSVSINLVQNPYGFPRKLGQSIIQNFLEKSLKEKSSRYKPAVYDYQIDIGDNLYKSPSGVNLEDQLMNIRKSLGLQVHSNRLLGKAIKYFLYNRYQNIDGGNLTFNRLTTHIFFTRPDLNLLYNGNTGNKNGLILDEIKNFADAFLIWQRNPNIFRLLTDCDRTGESSPNNFNLLLSNQITNIEFKDENIETVKSTPNWKDYQIEYGGSYRSRGNGELQCTFLETDDLAVLDLFKLWTMYIDNVTLGTWKPSYNLRRGSKSDPKVSINSPFDSHIYTRTLDYAASCYAFKLAPDGEEILYWTKYYGIIPKSFTLSQLNYTKGEVQTSPLQITVTFAYSFKRDLSPISLLEFNKIANIDDNSIDAKSVYESNFDESYDKVKNGIVTRASGVRSGVPLVEAPFISIYSNKDAIGNSNSHYGLGPLNPDQDFKLLLKFKPVPNQDNDPKSGDPTFNYANIYRTTRKDSITRTSGDNYTKITQAAKKQLDTNKLISGPDRIPEYTSRNYVG